MPARVCSTLRTLEFELLSRQHFCTRRPGPWSLALRLHSTDGMLCPIEFERRQAAAAATVIAA